MELRETEVYNLLIPPFFPQEDKGTLLLVDCFLGTVSPDLIYNITVFLLVSFCALFLQMITGRDIK